MTSHFIQFYFIFPFFYRKKCFVGVSTSETYQVARLDLTEVTRHFLSTSHDREKKKFAYIEKKIQIQKNRKNTFTVQAQRSRNDQEKNSREFKFRKKRYKRRLLSTNCNLQNTIT